MGLPIIKTYAFSASQGSSSKTNPDLYIILHEVGVNNSPAANNASYFKHNWATSETYSTFVVGHDGDYLVSTPGYVSWAALSANPYAPVQIEFERTSSEAEFKAGYKNYITLARYYAKKYGIPLTLDKGGAGTPGIKSHLWVTKHYGGTHTDPYGYLAKWGITKSRLAYDLAHGVGTNVEVSKATPSKSSNTTSKSTTSAVQKTAKVINVGTKLTLPKTASEWYIYPLDKSPVVGNQVGSIHPKTSGIVNYKIYDWTQNNVAVINTSKYGKVQIYVGPSTGAIITGGAYPATVTYHKSEGTLKLINNKYHYFSHVPGDLHYNNYDHGVPKKGSYKIDLAATRIFKDKEGTQKTYYYYRILYNKQSDGTYKSKAWVNSKAFENTNIKVSSEQETTFVQKKGTYRVIANLADVYNNPSDDETPSSTLKLDDTLTIDGYVDSDNWRWITYLTRLGKRQYVKMRSLDGRYLVGVIS